jgi:hypothetical protein
MKMKGKAFDNRPAQKSNKNINVQSRSDNLGTQSTKSVVDATTAEKDPKGVALAKKALAQHKKNAEMHEGTQHMPTCY